MGILGNFAPGGMRGGIENPPMTGWIGQVSGRIGVAAGGSNAGSLFAAFPEPAGHRHAWQRQGDAAMKSS